MKIPMTITRLEEIYDNYDAFILDQWGVMHDGEKGYLNAIKCIEMHRSLWKRISMHFHAFQCI